jgi:hypothetical protein
MHLALHTGEGREHRGVHEKGIVMSGRTACGLLLLAGVAALAPSSSGATVGTRRTDHRVAFTATAKVLKVENGTATLVGLVEGSYGEGAIIYRRTPVGSREQPVGTTYFKDGTISGTGLIGIAPAHGGVTFSGTLRMTGGTGRYAGVTGRLTASGTADAALTTISIKLAGVIRY